MCCIFHALFTQSWAPSSHHTDAAIFDGFMDGGRIAAPQPITVGQVRKAFRAFGIRAVALDTIGIEQVLTNFARFCIVSHLF